MGCDPQVIFYTTRRYPTKIGTLSRGLSLYRAVVHFHFLDLLYWAKMPKGKVGTYLSRYLT